VKRFLILWVLGAATAVALCGSVEVRRALRVPTHPVLLAEYTSPTEDVEDVAAPDATAPRAARRMSWHELERRRPKSVAADPLVGKMQILYMDAPLEMRLSSVLQAAGLQLPILKVGIATRGGRSIAGVDFYSGTPPARAPIEDTAVRIITLAFQTIETLDEIDLTAVPWRSVKQYKPPAYFSVAARRIDYLPPLPDDSPRLLLDRYGAAWWDPRIMSDFPATEPSPAADDKHSARI
jgi:hypothetical protein